MLDQIFDTVYSSCIGPTRAADLQPSDLIYVQDDPYADPDDTAEALTDAYVLVESVMRESENVVRIGTQKGDSYEFPAEHLVDVEHRPDA